MSGRELIKSTQKRITEAGRESKRLKVLPPGTLIYSMYASLGHVAELAISATINQALLGFEFKKGVYKQYVKWQLRHLQKRILEEASSNTQDNLNAEKVRNLPIPLPKYEIQVAIADYLDCETARLDGLVTTKKRLLELLEEKRRSLITHAVTRGLNPNVTLLDTGIPWLGMIPEHWEVTRLKFVAEVQGGLTLGKNYEARELIEYPYLRVANVQDGHIDLSDVEKILVPQAEAESCLLQSGDVLMNEGGDADKLGRGSIWFGEITPCLHQNHVFAVRPKLIRSEWLNVWTSTEGAKGYFESRAKQSTNLASISATNIKELPVPIPPDNEQSTILAYVETEIAKLDSLYSATERTISLLKERRETLIAAVVTGKIEVA
jgi:type I restriction enzyme S subunit